MSWGFQYTPYVWPMLASVALMWALGLYSWRHRSSPGAVALSVACGLAGLWALGNACELSFTVRDVAFWWFRFQMFVSTPAAVAALCFVLQYAGLGRWLSRTALTLLFAPSVLMLPVYLVNDAALLWSRVDWVDGRFARVLTPLGVAWNLYGLVILSLTVAAATVLFVRSPLYRKPAALLMLGHSAIVGAQALEMRWPVPVLQPNLLILSIDFALVIYAVAFFRYRLLDVVPVARDSAIERMLDAMIVLDARQRIADLNLAAQQLLGVRRDRALGSAAERVLAALPGLASLAVCESSAEGEVSREVDGVQRWYRVTTSSLEDGRGLPLGCLMVVREVTELRVAQQRLIQQERSVATLHEREYLARELHDGIGQVLGYLSLQAEATRQLLRDGRTAEADAGLVRLAGVSRDAHADLRGFILDLRTAPSERLPFFAALNLYLDGFSQNYGVQTALEVEPGLDEGAFTAAAQAQVLRIIQEALTNARRHGGARSVQVTLETANELVRIIVQDDGSGFDPAALAQSDGSGLGLQFMRERAEELGGRIEVDSAPGRGTRVVVELPLGSA